MFTLEDFREYYEHDSNCSGNNFTEPNDENGLKQCLDCAGVFDQDGNGVAVTSKKFDEH